MFVAIDSDNEFLGWLFKLEVKNADELKSLLGEDAYEKFKAEEQDH